MRTNLRVEMVNPNRFYTYAYLREDRTPYYIGKGCGDRIYSPNRTINKPKNKSRIIFLKQNLTEEEAFKHEKYMISVFGRKDLGTGILRNKTDGGDGASGAIVSEKTKRKKSEKVKGKNNPFYGKTHSKETRKKLSESHKGKNNPNYGKRGENSPNYGKKHTEDSKNRIKENQNLKSFSVISPTGEIIHSKNVNQFCRDNNLYSSCFSNLLSGKLKSHKGFRLYIP